MEKLTITEKMHELINLVSQKNGELRADKYIDTFTAKDVENILFEIKFKNRECDGRIDLWKGISNIYLIIALGIANAHLLDNLIPDAAIRILLFFFTLLAYNGCSILLFC